MNKQELIEAIEQLRDNLTDYQTEAFMMSEDIDKTSEQWETIKDALIEADDYLDNCINSLEEALNNANELTEFDKEVTFLDVCQKFVPNRILCNAIADVDEGLHCNPIMGNEQEEIGEIMQYYLTDLTGNDVDYIIQHHTRFYFAYSEKLGLWIMLIDHYGKSWDYVSVKTDLDIYDEIQN